MKKNQVVICLIFCVLCIFSPFQLAAQTQTKKHLSLKLNADSVIHQMKGGIGASWHTLIHEMPFDNTKYDFPASLVSPRGSAFAGNPPLADTAAWKQLYKYANWLGLNFVRVEMAQHMYEPKRNVFDWNNDEMQTLYRILDWCEANHADVFLQQMWGQVEWNSFNGVHPLVSSPKSVDDFANGIATMLKYLTLTKKYKCIKYFCMVNEPPGGTWGYWWSAGSYEGPTITDAWEALNKAFKRENISIPISGPDWTDLPPCNPEKMKFDKYLSAFDIHSYHGIYSRKDGSKIINDWVKYAASKSKPFFVSEIGNMNLGWGRDNPAPKSFKASLSNASDIVLGMNLGVDGFNRWSFTNRGNLDGQWQLVKTYDIPSKTYLNNVQPEKEAYYGYGMITRFMGKYVSILSTKSDQKLDGVIFTSYKNRDGNITILVVNNTKESVILDIAVENANKKQTFYLYQVTENILKTVDFKLNPVTKYKKSNIFNSVEILPESITVLTTNGLRHENCGVIE